MPVREILLLGNPELWRPSSPVVDVHARETRDLIGDLAVTLDNFRRQNGFGDRPKGNCHRQDDKEGQEEKAGGACGTKAKTGVIA